MKLESKLPYFNDPGGSGIPEDLPEVIDAHVHIFPRNLLTSIRKWFEKNAWSIRYKYSTTGILEHLLSCGVSHIIALQYAHKPGISRMLNQYMVKKCTEFNGSVTGMATVFPGEKDGEIILKEAFDHGLKGVKLHAHVQCFNINTPKMDALFDLCESEKKPMIIHAGREPKSSAYNCDPYEICSAKKLESVLKNFSGLKICVPHLGLDEIAAYRKLIEKYDNLWLDTAMTLSGYFPMTDMIKIEDYRIDRIMYGSDFPNIPYAWDRELKWLSGSGLPRNKLKSILKENTVDFFGLEL